MLLVAFYFVLSALAAACKNTGSQHSVCAEGKCEMIGNTEICTQCQTGKVPIDGKCVDAATASANCKNASGNSGSDRVCEKCEGVNFFMYKGGCYVTTKAPGQTMCKTANAGKCIQAVQGYFLPPDADRDNAHQSVIPCGDVEEVLAGNSHKYKGVLHCTRCEEPTAADNTTPKAAACTTCEDGFFVDSSKGCTACDGSCKTCGAEGKDKCKSCKDGYFLGAATGGEGRCISCGAVQDTWSGVENCAKCTQPTEQNKPAVCTECKDGFYFKAGEPPSCVSAAQCTGGFFPTTDAQSNNKKVCVSCGTTNSGGIEGCEKCTPKESAARAETGITCTKCSSKKLSPLGDACLTDCPAGTYAVSGVSGSVCTPCHESCASCSTNAEASCTACYPGSVLEHNGDTTTGKCIQECTGKYAENCEAGQCTAVVGGSKYCSKCKAGFAPVDGVCVPVTQRTPTGCTPGNSGTCTSCTGKYFPESGGCYQAEKFPGKMLCTTTDNNGKCTDCANGQTADNSSGSCPACDPTCATCEASKPKACQTCFPGSYFDSAVKVCKLCTENSNDGKIKGVENCTSCTLPAGGNGGSVICYVKMDGTNNDGNDNTGGSTNKSGLSTGAIVGISVAVIVVVGGLVGFLCWWFVCRGKA